MVVPAPSGADAIRLWDLCTAYVAVPGLYELKTPKSNADLAAIGRAFTPYLEGRQWQSVQNPAP